MNSKSGIPSLVAWCGVNTSTLGYVGGSFTFFSNVVITPDWSFLISCGFRDVDGRMNSTCPI